MTMLAICQGLTKGCTLSSRRTIHRSITDPLAARSLNLVGVSGTGGSCQDAGRSFDLKPQVFIFHLAQVLEQIFFQ